MNSKDILFRKKVMSYELETKTLKNASKKVITYHYVIWKFTDGEQKMDITQEEYNILYNELIGGLECE